MCYINIKSLIQIENVYLLPTILLTYKRTKWQNDEAWTVMVDSICLITKESDCTKIK